MQKPRLQLDDSEVERLAEHGPETGLGFYVLSSRWGLTACNVSGWALPLERSRNFFDAFDLTAGLAIPANVQVELLDYTNVAADRSQLTAMMAGLTLPPGYSGSAGALPLIASDTLRYPTRFVRMISGPADHRYVNGKLTVGTYLTTPLDCSFANSGFSAVGRYALPIPVPSSTQIQYELPAGTKIKVGTVAPMFGQSGGGVEVNLVSDTPANQVAVNTLPDY
ncbi:MAG: hypothetical protein PHP86_18045 [Nevskiales bacterium]|nr:hypothetical protein [Nevskiales bacterium]